MVVFCAHPLTVRTRFPLTFSSSELKRNQRCKRTRGRCCQSSAFTFPDNSPKKRVPCGKAHRAIINSLLSAKDSRADLNAYSRRVAANRHADSSSFHSTQIAACVL